MPKLFGSFRHGSRNSRPRRFCLEELEIRVLPAVLAGGEVCSPAELVSQSVPEPDFPRMTEADSTSKLDVALVISYSTSVVSQTDVLEESVTAAQTDDILYAQIWIKNADGSSQAVVGGYLDLTYTESVFEAGLWIPGELFSNLADYAVLEQSGRVAMAGGMSSPGETSLAVDSWALLGTVSFMATGEGVGSIQTGTPTYNGAENEAFNLARLGVGTLASSEISFGDASVTVAGGAEPLAVPSIRTGRGGLYVSHGANRHEITWSAVANASSYELAWSADGLSWNSLVTTDLSAVVTGLTYGRLESYRVRALGSGSYTNSNWSAVRSFYVCPVDLNGDGDVSGGDRAILSSKWLTSEGEDNFAYYADVNGDGDVTGVDRGFLSANWLLSIESEHDEFVYPPARAAAVLDQLFVSLGDAELDLL